LDDCECCEVAAFQRRPGLRARRPADWSLREVGENYLRRTSARHLPSGVTVTFRRDITGNRHAELCFAGLDHYLPWNEALAEEWLAALFLQDRPRVREVTEGVPQAVRHFMV
jgi:hypothetical protein